MGVGEGVALVFRAPDAHNLEEAFADGLWGLAGAGGEAGSDAGDISTGGGGAANEVSLAVKTDGADAGSTNVDEFPVVGVGGYVAFLCECSNGKNFGIGGGVGGGGDGLGVGGGDDMSVRSMGLRAAVVVADGPL